MYAGQVSGTSKQSVGEAKQSAGHHPVPALWSGKFLCPGYKNFSTSCTAFAFPTNLTLQRKIMKTMATGVRRDTQNRPKGLKRRMKNKEDKSLTLKKKNVYNLYICYKLLHPGHKLLSDHVLAHNDDSLLGVINILLELLRRSVGGRGGCVKASAFLTLSRIWKLSPYPLHSIYAQQKLHSQAQQ